jgi:glucose/arabinose dehydrogenase
MQPRPILACALALAGLAVLAAPAARGADRSGLTVPRGFSAEKIATVSGARELAVAPNGDLLVGTNGNTVAIVPSAQGKPGAAQTFATFDDRPVAGVFVDGDTLYAGGQFGVYRMPYHAGDRETRAKPQKIASLRTSGRSRDHVTTTVVATKGKVYASVGSSCNACNPELDPTRATVQEMNPDGSGLRARAVDIRNAIALAVQPGSGDVWAGVAGRDDLDHGHPYEIFDDVSAHAGTPDYGWLKCYDDRKPISGATCDGVVVPKSVFPAYDTPIGAAFYPADGKGAHAFPAAYRGGAFVALHGSWHTPPVPPRVAFVAFRGNDPAKGIDWNDPGTQWRDFVSGCQTADGSRDCRPTGVAVGTDGSLFVSEDDGGNIYRIRPSGR